VRLLIADDHALFRRGLRRLFTSHGMEVVGEAGNGRDAGRLYAELRPDVVVMDLSMPVVTGTQAIATILAHDPEAKVLVLTMSAEESEVLDALLAGACGYLLKEAPPDQIIAGVHAAVAAESLISPRIASRLVVRLRELGNERPVALDADLTEREVEILRLIATGKENSAIASELFISPKTVKNHVASILDKLALENRIQAAVMAVRSGIVRD